MSARTRRDFQIAALLLLAVIHAAGTFPRLATAAVSGSWHGVPLADVAVAVTPLLGRPLVIDCRVDPTAPITLIADGLSAEQLLEAIEQQSGREVVILRESVRLAPAGRRAALQAAEESRISELTAASPALRAGLSRQTRGGWPAAATPREIVSKLAMQAGGDLKGLDLVPHDQLGSLQLPAMSRAAQLDLVLAGYDLRAAIRQTGLEVVRLDPSARPQRPPKIRPPRQPPKDQTASGGTTVFSLDAAAPLQQLLATICAQTGLKLRIDRESLQQSGISPDQIVRVSLQEASRAELLDAVTKPLGIGWQIEGRLLIITARLPPTAAGSAGGGPPQD